MGENYYINDKVASHRIAYTKYDVQHGLLEYVFQTARSFGKANLRPAYGPFFIWTAFTHSSFFGLV
jgi:hypothetical protein